MYLAKGKEYLDEKYHAIWEEMVPHRCKDLYYGMELGATLAILPYVDRHNFQVAKKVMDDQGHSGMSGSLVLSMIASLSDNGKEFYGYMK